MYLLDTDICIYVINKKPAQVIERIKKCRPHQIKLSAVSLGELAYGVAKSRQKEKNHRALLYFSSAFDILSFSDNDAEVFGGIRAYLEKRGEVIGPYDMQIAAQAITRDLILVTNNRDEFSRVPHLKLANWV